MAVQSSVVVARAHEGQSRPIRLSDTPPKRPPFFILFPLSVVFFLTFVMLLVIALSRIATTPRVIEPPIDLLPGRPLPMQASCAAPFGSACYAYSLKIKSDGETAFLTADSTLTTITYTRIQSEKYRIADLLLAWGTPTGVQYFAGEIKVYWPTRKAFLSACSFQPYSQVDFIEYGLNTTQARPWRGFAAARGDDC